MSSGIERREMMLHQVAEASRRRRRVVILFAQMQEAGLNPGWIKCGYCAGETIVSPDTGRQHITCMMCGGQMIGENQHASGLVIIRLDPVTAGAPYREWVWDDPPGTLEPGRRP